jgi:hypothetical protein
MWLIEVLNKADNFDLQSIEPATEFILEKGF